MKFTLYIIAVTSTMGCTIPFEPTEEWVSYDKGDSWERFRNIVPDVSEYPGWRYNNIQPVTKPDGTTVDGLLLFYGWKEKDAPEAKAFLFQEN